MNIRILVDLLNELKINKSEVTLLGLSSLVLRGILKDTDILEIAVTENVLNDLKNRYDVKNNSLKPNHYIVKDNVECVLDNSNLKKEYYSEYYLQDINDCLNDLKNENNNLEYISLIEKYITRTYYANKYAVLETPRLILRKAKREDLGDIYNNIWTDASLANNMLWRVATDLESSRKRLDYNIFLQRHNFSYFIVLKETNHVIGWAGVNELEPHIFEDYGICLAAKYHGQGLGKEVLGVLEELVFESLGGDKFIYTCFKTNKQSSGLCMSKGFSYLSSEARVREHDGMQYILDKYVLDYETYLNIKNNIKK